MPFDWALQFTFTFTLFLNCRGVFSEKVKANFSVLSHYAMICRILRVKKYRFLKNKNIAHVPKCKAAIKIQKLTNKLQNTES